MIIINQMKKGRSGDHTAVFSGSFRITPYIGG
jgi:hypothetical protein